MNFINSVRLTIKYLWTILRTFYSDEMIIGAYCRMDWSGHDYPEICYISFSSEPRIYEGDDYEMDDYGILDDDIFYYSGRKEFMNRLWTKHPIDTWRIAGFVMNTSKPLKD